MVSVGAANFRPAHLPPKSASDSARHAKEVAHMSRLYRDKLRREAERAASLRESKAQAAKLEAAKREELRKKALEREKNLEIVGKLWIENILPAWETYDSAPARCIVCIVVLCCAAL